MLEQESKQKYKGKKNIKTLLQILVKLEDLSEVVGSLRTLTMRMETL